jgi:protein-S-isoprenylcysteine O-methyltransferase Ste14
MSKNNRLSGLLFLILSFALFLMGAASVVAMIHALTVRDTLAAIESGFGTLILAAGLLAFSWISLKAGLNRLGTTRTVDRGR